MKHSGEINQIYFKAETWKFGIKTLKRRTNDGNVSLAVIYYVNNIEGKITECWLLNEESIFSLILLREEGKITRSRLALRLPSNSLFDREVAFL